MRDLIKEIENEDTERLQKLYDAVGNTIGDASYAIYKEIQDVLKRRKEEERKPKGIDVVMSCGEIYHIATDQLTIEKVRINGDQIYPSKTSVEIKDEEDIVKFLEKLTGEKWEFGSWCTYRENGDLYEASFRDGPTGCSPLRKHIDTVIIPWFKGNRNAYSEYHRVK